MFTPQPCQLFPFGRRQPGAPLGAIGLRVFDPEGQTRRCEVQLAGHGGHALALVEDQTHGLLFEVISEPPTRPAIVDLGHCGHRTHHSGDVYSTGSLPEPLISEYFYSLIQSGGSAMIPTRYV